MSKKYNTPKRSIVVKTRMTDEEYADFTERVKFCVISQSEFLRQAIENSAIKPIITVSPVNEKLLSAVGQLTAQLGKIGGNLNQIARFLNEPRHAVQFIVGRGPSRHCRLLQTEI